MSDAARVRLVVARTPGLRADEIAERVALPTAYVSAQLRALVKERIVKRRGNTRGTRYYAP